MKLRMEIMLKSKNRLCDKPTASDGLELDSAPRYTITYKIITSAVAATGEKAFKIHPHAFLMLSFPSVLWAFQSFAYILR